MKDISNKVSEGNPPTTIEKRFYVVALGGSAGSLGAMEQFFINLPLEIGMAFVVVQHLAPDSESVLPEIISRNTKLPVKRAEEMMLIEPNIVYIIPPNKQMSVLNGMLHLSELPESRSQRWPIDMFFTSMAENYKDKSIGIIFSGMGSDGASGAKSIKVNGGLVLVQAPESASFDSMPKNTIASGSADYVLSVEEIPELLMNHVQHLSINHPRITPISEEKYNSAFYNILELVKKTSGHDFSMYKHNTIARRIERRMVSHQLEKISDYYRFLKENPSEVEILFKELLINVTNFFRDTDGFETIKNVVLPRILKTKKEGEVIRIWVAGCSTGEEAYSIAIIVNEVLSSEEKNKKLKVQIFATDIDEISIEKARSGIFAMDITGFVSPERLQNYFIKKTNGYVIKKEIREMVVFAPQSIIKDPPFTKLDVISCRNLLIYLNTEIQKKIMTLFHYSLNKKGYLFLGASEGISGYTNLYEPLESKHRIYQKKESAEAIHEIIHFPLVPSQEHKIKSSAENIQSRKRPSAELSTIIQKSLLDKYAPPSVITNKAGDIIYVNGNTSKYLELSSGQLNTNIFNMCSDSLSFELKSAIAELSKQKSKIIQKNVKIKCNGDLFLINLSVKALGDSKDLSGLILVVFEDDKFSHSKPLGKKNKKNGEESSSLSLESELEYTKQQYQQTLEQMEASLEELTLVAEESQSTNEELQSANEELTTSKEEMQSLNEELVALNAEMHTKMEEYTQTSSDMRNLLYSTQIATIFLDKDLTLRYFTPQTNKIIKLIKTDIGRPITDLALNLEYDYLIEDVKEVIEFLSIKELQVQTFSKIWYAMRISPYKTIDNYIDGVVLTFTDITLHKKYDEEKFAREFAENIINTMREPLVVLDSFLKIISVNNAFYKVFDLKKENVIGKDLFMISNGSWDIPPLKELLLEILPQKNELEDFEVVHTFEGIGKKRILLNARTMIGAHKQAGMILLAMEVFSA